MAEEGRIFHAVSTKYGPLRHRSLRKCMQAYHTQKRTSSGLHTKHVIDLDADNGARILLLLRRHCN